jgi:hypothetical protein
MFEKIFEIPVFPDRVVRSPQLHKQLQYPVPRFIFQGIQLHPFPSKVQGSLRVAPGHPIFNGRSAGLTVNPLKPTPPLVTPELKGLRFDQMNPCKEGSSIKLGHPLSVPRLGGPDQLLGVARKLGRSHETLRVARKPCTAEIASEEIEGLAESLAGMGIVGFRP